MSGREVAPTDLPSFPIGRPSAIVRNRKHRDDAFESNEHDVTGQVVDGKPAYVAIGNARNRGAASRERFDVSDRAFYLVDEPCSHVGVAFSIPLDRLPEVSLSRGAEENHTERDSTS